uniref:DNA-directed RNA polymerase RBP11-like dimerisation domain-containing protein n=1 Tax=Chromera velia CCMP2878 TaxID=1169474 RepID=A0A0G4IE36_9ALVE|mmetsp:Transcript_36735/g.72289  ORF Transcript_36735/g.72289 Transcript_36735/m.72289 type:complete len:153 (-) Transcript_36735:92-550(-)|eukprot:Cvel_13599.t1-p1 / transcript=Cvel_13599.t1 / gene=Cvel_13599 / organism=Chromera_velia_CCMP2878 / gene_product=DNA-directed RNA polymerases I and III subunit, putative / transcript_product=DNA-directed RNA polymerases I and III subunit, putative / location=Cvel_scaffold936:1428-3141(-) / protein_length=152 / sequence_SO=supercontig / SO=protein_coding / is_pseudo=false
MMDPSKVPPAEKAGEDQERMTDKKDETAQEHHHGNKSRNASIFVRGERDTLGNALRNMLLRHPEVEYCGYTPSHPSGQTMFTLRLQTTGRPAVSILRESLVLLKEVFAHFDKTFVKEFAEMRDRMEREKSQDGGQKEKEKEEKDDSGDVIMS